MDRDAILRLLDEERRTIAHDGSVLDTLPSITRGRSDDDSQHWIIYSSLTSSNAEKMIEEQIEHYQKLNASFEWKVFSHDSPPDLMDRLQSRGFVIGPCEAVMIFDLF